MNTLPVVAEGREWAVIKRLVLDTLQSEHSRDAYERGLDDFLAFYRQQSLPLSKAVVQAWVRDMQARGLAASTINQRLAAVRRLFNEAADNGAVDQDLARAVQNVRGVRREGVRLGRWLTAEEAARLITTPDATTVKGRRDRALLALLIGAGLRRHELVKLQWEHVQMRAGRWLLVDIVGKRNRVRSVPIAAWVVEMLEPWARDCEARLGEPCGYIARRVRAVPGGYAIDDEAITPQAVYWLVKDYAEKADLGDVAPHDLRRTFAHLAREGGAALEQIQLALGHTSILTTERYLSTTLDLQNAASDKIKLPMEVAT